MNGHTLFAHGIGAITAAFLFGVAAANAQKAPPRLSPVDLELAFVVDASGSIDEDEMRLQRQGYAQALAHPRVQSAISSGFLRSIAVAYIEFAGDGCTELTVGWTRISDKATAEAFGGRILASDRNFCFGGNAVSEALVFAAATIEANEFEGTRRVIDLSGDGPNTMGEPVEDIRDAIVRNRIIINALAIDRPSMPDLPEYFKRSVTGGPGSFVIKAKNRQNFAEAILKKLIREIADRSPWPKRRAAMELSK
ncbi:MAG: DUF1194 domain-containing protein [Rhodospirillaceae bacterium]|jgi:hypothetical protein|nr:DUF1194 domain-containing protein [Rhodospirillaceae bacterium]MBT5457455.1 DUF1194 domain-containing protein [Rhodospirillaceae bacterium]